MSVAGEEVACSPSWREAVTRYPTVVPRRPRCATLDLLRFVTTTQRKSTDLELAALPVLV